MHPAIKALEEEQLKKDLPRFKVGDTIRVAVRVEEGDKTRTQNFEGTVIKKQGSSIRESFTVRRISFGEGVERNFPLHSPTVQGITVVRSGNRNLATEGLVFMFLFDRHLFYGIGGIVEQVHQNLLN